jgi:hypothetical protein
MEKGTPSSRLVPAYEDKLLAAIRQADPAVVAVEVSEQWHRIKVHAIPVQRYLYNEHGLELAREEIELGTTYRLKRDPTWLKPASAIRASKQRFATIVITVGTLEEARGLLDRGIKFGGQRYRTGEYWESNAEAICPRCCGIGHTGYRACGGRPPKCTICSGDHEALEHSCTVRGCGAATAKPCQHTVIKCANCAGEHEATSPKCPRVREARQQAMRKARERLLTPLLPKSFKFGIFMDLPLKKSTPAASQNRPESPITIREETPEEAPKEIQEKQQHPTDLASDMDIEEEVTPTKQQPNVAPTDPEAPSSGESC